MSFSHFRILAFCAVLPFLNAQALEPYHQQSETGIKTFQSNYYVLGKWHLRCVEQTTGAGVGTKWCELELTTGERYPRTGIYETGGPQPQVEIWKRPGKAVSVQVEVGYQGLRGTNVVLEIGGKRFEKVWDSGPDSRRWEGNEANEILSAMIASGKVSYDYVDGARRKHVGDSDFRGLAEILKVAEEFLGVELLKDKTESQRQ